MIGPVAFPEHPGARQTTLHDNKIEDGAMVPISPSRSLKGAEPN
jgi:hypothetical protein